MVIEVVQTGIHGFDEILNGGIPKRNVALLASGPGAGKPIFSYQYLYNGLIRKELGCLSLFEERGCHKRLLW